MLHHRLLRLASATPGPTLALAGFGVLIAVLHVAFAVCVGTAVGAVVAGQGPAVPALAALAAVAVVRAVVTWVQEPLAARVGVGVRTRLRARLLENLAAVPAAERDSGRDAATVLDGVDGLDAYCTRYLPQLVVVLVVPCGIVLVVATYSRAAAGVLAVTAAVAVLLPRLSDARLVRHGRRRWRRFEELAADYVEALQSIPLLRAFGAAGRVGDRLAARAEDLRRSTMDQLRVSLVDTGVTTLAVQLGCVVAVVVALGAAVDGRLPAGATVTVMLLARECFRPVSDLARHWHAGYQGLTAVDGIDRLLSARPQVREEGTCQVEAREPAGVVLAGVSYRYPATDVGVTDITLRVSPGETLAVIGPSGSGKSTLARLLERDVDPDRGSVRIGGRDLRDYDRAARARSVVVVPQDPALFAWTVRDNLRLYRPEATDDELVEAARAAEVHHVLAALPQGYATVLAEDGAQLSGGQRQRLAVARALVSAAPVLVLDEVTSALDPDTERRLVRTIAQRDRHRTTIVVAHRPGACAHADRWVALDAGRVAGAGSGPPTAGLLAGAGR